MAKKKKNQEVRQEELGISKAGALAAVAKFESKQLRKRVPLFSPGDTIRVNTRVVEGNKERIQAFEGVCIRRAGSGLGETFTVRKLSYGIGVERTFPMTSPRVESVALVRHGRVRRAKLYYLRDRVGKATRIPQAQRSIVAKRTAQEAAAHAAEEAAEKAVAQATAAEAPVTESAGENES